MNPERQQALQNDLFNIPQSNLPPPVPPRSQPATGSLFTTALPTPNSYTPSFPPASSLPVATRYRPGFGPQANPSYPPDPLLGGYSQGSSLPPPVPPHAYKAPNVGKRPGVPGTLPAFSSLSGAYHQPPPQRVSPSVNPPQLATPSSTKDAEKVAQVRIHYMEGLINRLQKEKKGMEDEYGRQRKKFMNQMMQTESELNSAKEAVTEHAEQMENLNKLLLAKKEEVISLKQKLEEANTNVTVGSETKEALSITSTKRRSRSPRSPFGRHSPSPDGTTPTSLNFTSESSLETHMVKAAEDAKLLRSVVVPLEEEIDLLKMKLNQAEERLRIYEGKESTNFGSQAPSPSTSSVVPSLAQQSLYLQGGEMPEVSDASLLQKLLSQEQVARTDLEKHVESLGRQKAMLHKDMEAMTAELKQMKEELCKEQLSHTSLREAWDKANIHFLSTASNQPTLQVKEAKLQDSEMVDCQTPTPLTPFAENKQVGASISPPSLRRKRERALSWPGREELTGRDDGDDVEAMWKAVIRQLQKSVMRLNLEVENKSTLCENYEKQMQRVQEQLLKEIDDKDFTIDRLKSEITKLEASILRDRKSRADAQRSLLAEMEDAKAKIETYQAQESKIQKKVKKMSEKFTETKHEVQKEVTRFSAERIHLNEQLDQVREEYKCLKEVHLAQSNDYRAKMSAEIQARTEAEMNLKAAVDEISTLQLDKDTTELSMANQLSEMQQQLTYSRQERQRLESELGMVTTQLARLLRDKSNLEAVKNEALDSQASTEEKSRLFIEQQQQKIEELVQEKESMEQTLDSTRKQVAALKQQLQSSEANQKDFVELSQSLQVKLVEMEEAQQRKQLEEVQQRERIADGLSNSSSPSPPETAALLPL